MTRHRTESSFTPGPDYWHGLRELDTRILCLQRGQKPSKYTRIQHVETWLSGRTDYDATGYVTLWNRTLLSREQKQSTLTLYNSQDAITRSRGTAKHYNLNLTPGHEKLQIAEVSAYIGQLGVENSDRQVAAKRAAQQAGLLAVEREPIIEDYFVVQEQLTLGAHEGLTHLTMHYES